MIVWRRLRRLRRRWLVHCPVCGALARSCGYYVWIRHEPGCTCRTQP